MRGREGESGRERERERGREGERERRGSGKVINISSHYCSLEIIVT